MTIESAPSEISYDGNGATLAYAIPFPFDTSADIRVFFTDSSGAPVEQTTGFSISGGGGSTGTCTFVVAPPALTTVTIFDDPEQTQPVDYVSNDAFPAETHEKALDRVTRLVKRLNQRVDRSIRVEDGDLIDGVNNLLPISSARAGKFLGFDGSGAPTVLSGTGNDSALRTDLATSTLGAQGSRLVAHKPAATGAVAMTLYAILTGQNLTPDMFGCVADSGVTNNTVNLQKWLDAIPADGSGYLPGQTGYYGFTGNLTVSTRKSIVGDGRASRLHHSGSGVGITFAEARFCTLRNWLLTGTATGDGGVYFQKGNECTRIDGFMTEGYTKVGAYGWRFSDCWTMEISGAPRQNYIGLWFDTTSFGFGGINNHITLNKVDASECGKSLIFQSGDTLIVNGLDCSNGGGIVAPITAIEIGCNISGTKNVRNVSIKTHIENGAGFGIKVGENNTSSQTPTQIEIRPSFFNSSGTHIRFYKATQVQVHQSVWSSGAVVFDAGVTNIENHARGVTVTDNTSGEVASYTYDSLAVDSIVARGDLQSGMNRLRVTRNGVVQSINSGAPTKVQWTTEDLDTPAAFDNAVNFRWTPTKAGWYRIHCELQLQAMAAGNFMQLSVYKNGTRHRCTNLYVAAAGAPTIDVDALCQANGTTDYFEIFIEHNNGVARNVEGAVDSTWFEGHPAV